MTLRSSLFGLLVGMVLGAGCASSGSQYLLNRKQDALDIFTCSVGTGLGAKARVGPLQVGAIGEVEMFGLRGGVASALPWFTCHRCYMEELLPIPLRGRAKDNPLDVFGREDFAGGNASDYGTAIRRMRGKAYTAHAPLPVIGIADQPEYYTQLEVVVGVWPSLRLGFNPGEVVDFLLGWIGVDIYGDDLKRQDWTAKMPTMAELVGVYNTPNSYTCIFPDGTFVEGPRTDKTHLWLHAIGYGRVDLQSGKPPHSVIVRFDYGSGTRDYVLQGSQAPYRLFAPREVYAGYEFGYIEDKFRDPTDADRQLYDEAVRGPDWTTTMPTFADLEGSYEWVPGVYDYYLVAPDGRYCFSRGNWRLAGTAKLRMEESPRRVVMELQDGSLVGLLGAGKPYRLFMTGTKQQKPPWDGWYLWRKGDMTEHEQDYLRQAIEFVEKQAAAKAK